MEPGCGKITTPAEAIHLHDDAIESGERPVNLPMPYLPLQCVEFLVDLCERSGNHRTAAHGVISDLPHGWIFMAR
jgi:hypothetical protein